MQKRKGVFDRVTESIEQVRKPGDPPMESLSSFDEYECDLCKGFVARKELIQCPYCGRWVCRAQCWYSDALSCLTCASIIKLSKESIQLEASTDEKAVDDGPDKVTGTEGGALRKLGGRVKEGLSKKGGRGD